MIHELGVRRQINPCQAQYLLVESGRNRLLDWPVSLNGLGHLRILHQIIPLHDQLPNFLRYRQIHSRHNTVCQDTPLHICSLKHCPVPFVPLLTRYSLKQSAQYFVLDAPLHFQLLPIVRDLVLCNPSQRHLSIF